MENGGKVRDDLIAKVAPLWGNGGDRLRASNKNHVLAQ